MADYPRTGDILNNRYFHYLISTTLTSAAGSLNWFVDSFVVSNLLGDEAMTIVNICNPVMLFICMIYSLVGVGGSSVYAGFLGQMEKKKAGVAFYYSLVVGMTVSIAFFIFGLIFSGQLSFLLCSGGDIYVSAIPYLRVLIISAPFIVFTGVLCNFIIVAGKPALATALNIISNVVNICLDCVFIRVFGTGVEGAAFATLTGYIVAIIIIIFCVLVKKSLKIELSRKRERNILKSSLQRGLSPAFNQLGFSIKILVCNDVAMSVAGVLAVTVFSVCIQTVTIVTIFLGGTLNAMFPILSLINGQKDNSGIRFFMKRIYIYQFAASVILFFVFFLFPEQIMRVYNITDDGLSIGVTALRIFAFSHLLRPVIMVFMYYTQTIGRKVYAVIISLVDGVAGVPLVLLLLIPEIGITALWLAFPLTAALLFAGIIITNLIILKKNPADYTSLLLLPRDEKNIKVFDTTVPGKKEDISEITKRLQDFCNEYLKDENKALRTAVACEEMCEYTLLHHGNKDFCMDITAKIYPENLVLNIRSLGSPIDPLSGGNEEEYSNIFVLNKMAKDVKYDYIMGMNQTRITI